jgi:hydrogenase expression/formation protein HypD
MEALLKTPELGLDGFICPPHVSAIIGTRPYDRLVEDHGIPCVVTGFEPLDILQGILMLIRQVRREEPRVEIQYRRVVTPEGNPGALAVMDAVFERCDGEWRGLGTIPQSGLSIREAYEAYDMRCRMDVNVAPSRMDKGCRCGDVLRAFITPPECPLFGKTCTQEHPLGACMVSSEGTCAAYFKYGHLPTAGR